MNNPRIHHTGRTAWRSLMLYREFSTGHAVVQTFDSSKRWPTWSLVIAVLAAIGLARWWMTRDALFYESIAGRFADTSVKAIRAAMRQLPGAPTSLVGAAVSRWNWEGGLSGPYTNIYPGEWGVYPDRLLIELVAVPGAIASLYIPALREAVAGISTEFWIFLQVVVYLLVVWLAVVWVTRLLGRADAFGVMRFFRGSSPLARHRAIAGPRSASSFVVFRAGLIRQAAVDLLLAVVLVMLASLTRTDTLGTTMIALAAGVVSGVVMYHFLASVVHVMRFEYRYPVGHRGEGIWVLWIIFSGLLAVATAVFCSIFVLVPFMQLHVTSANPGDFILVATAVYLFGLFLAFVLVDHEADRMELWIQRQRGLPARPPVNPLARLAQASNARA